ncbi:cytochrome c oxidase subunit 7A-related protein, mitochondrial-like [Acanthaster planci]|uniref:Cytochrome c oxidase subunit 7A-related protein, mitochondrial-like n=1 Tax=Acanthaster planci TaxID=133434 RepID=A0A8B7YEI0_ACAPL|nr:cytochrome c oxidase subunit 7A-related protein, mitochondrial-like [Acanthaster planci]
MAYKYNSMSGRVGSAPPQTAYSPAGLQATVTEPSQIVWDQKPKPVARFRSPMGGDGVMGSLIRNRVYENQRVFQKPDGLPVHLKKGFTDRISYSIVMALTVFGTAWTCYSLYKLAQPKK